MSLLVCNIITVACLALLLGELVGFILFYFIGAKTRKEKVEFVRSFKNGKFVFVYIIATPLYFVGHMYGNMDLIENIFTSINKVINLVILGFDTASIGALMAESELYFWGIYITFAFVSLNFAMFAISVFREYFSNALHLFIMKVGKKPHLYLMGNNKENISIYKSEKNRRAEIVGELDKTQRSQLYLEKCKYRDVDSFESAVELIFSSRVKKKRKSVMVINTGDDKKNLEICYKSIECLKKLIENKRENKKSSAGALRYESFIDIYVFGNPAYESGYYDAVKKGFGCIHYINKYKMVAEDLIEKCPYARFMTEEQIDYRTSLVKDGVEINSVFIGFGKANRQMFLTSVANNQFLHMENGEIKLKKVNYYVFDREIARANKNLNHSYYRFRNEPTLAYKAQCLPLPEIPANEEYEVLDVNSPEFYVNIKRVLTRSQKDANFINIAFGNDLENMDMAQKLITKIKEWGLRNVKIFVRIRGWQAVDSFLDERYCVPVGDEKNVVYNIDCIAKDKLKEMAMQRDRVYNVEYYLTEKNMVLCDALIERVKEETHNDWFKKMHETKRESNRFAILSLRSKLNMMGLDYCPVDADNRKGLTNDEYLKIYAGDDIPNYTDVKIDDKRVIRYPLEFNVSRRKTMAIQEHERWNSFMISQGFIPATRDQILSEFTVNNGKKRFTNGKDFDLRRHGNLTTFEGLVEYRRLIAPRDTLSRIKEMVIKDGLSILKEPEWFVQKFGSTKEAIESETVPYDLQMQAEACQFIEKNGFTIEEIKSDVIKYDYQILDDAHWLLSKNGYKIVPLNE